MFCTNSTELIVRVGDSVMKQCAAEYGAAHKLETRQGQNRFFRFSCILYFCIAVLQGRI